jgi:hypothetical protein
MFDCTLFIDIYDLPDLKFLRQRVECTFQVKPIQVLHLIA